MRLEFLANEVKPGKNWKLIKSLQKEYSFCNGFSFYQIATKISNGKDRLFYFCSCWTALTQQAITEINVRAKWIWDLAEKNTEDKLQVWRKCFIYQHTDFFETSFVTILELKGLYIYINIYIFSVVFDMYTEFLAYSNWSDFSSLLTICFRELC